LLKADTCRCDNEHFAKVDIKAANLVAANAAGGNDFAKIRAALASSEGETAEARQQLFGLDAPPMIALRPGLAQQNRKAIEQPHQELVDEDTRKKAAPPAQADHPDRGDVLKG
jgi:hypothetical protein